MIAVDVAQAAVELGGVSTKTVLRLIETNELAHCRIGRRVVIKTADIVDFLDRNRKPTDAELEAQASKRGVR